MSTMHADLTDLDVLEAARRFALELGRERRATMPVVEMMECPRCHGKGGVCFECRGSRQVIATEEGRAVRRAHGRRYANMRDDVMIRGYEMALSMLRGGMTARPLNLRRRAASEYRQHILDLKDTISVLREGEHGLAEFK